MHRFVPAVAAALLMGVALAGCSSASPDATPDASRSAPPTPATAAQPSTRSAAPRPTRSATGTGSIAFRGALSGTMTVSGCQSGIVQLVVAVDGQSSTYAGIIDADDFTFTAPHQAGFTLAKGAARPTVSGSTYTVKKTKLVGILNDATVTADGSVTCP